MAQLQQISLANYEIVKHTYWKRTQQPASAQNLTIWSGYGMNGRIIFSNPIESSLVRPNCTVQHSVWGRADFSVDLFLNRSIAAPNGWIRCPRGNDDNVRTLMLLLPLFPLFWWSMQIAKHQTNKAQMGWKSNSFHNIE